MLDQVLLLPRRPTVMLQYAARRSCATTLKRGRISQWRPPACTQTPCRSRSAGPAAVSDMNVWANPGAQVPLRQQGGVAAIAGRDIDRDDSLLTRTSTSLGRDVGRMVRSGQDSLEPEVVDLMISASKENSTGQSADTTFTIIAKAHRRARRQHLTLDLCEAVQEKTGKPLVPSTPAGLVLLLDAMQPKIARHMTRADAVDVGGERVKGLLRRYEEGGQVVPVAAYRAAIKVLDGPGCCLAALDLAREARSKLGDSAEGLGAVYSAVLNLCEERQAPDLMLTILEEGREAGGSLAPTSHHYASTLSCLGKARRVEEALKVFGDMLGRGEKPNAIAVNSMLAGFARDAPNFWKHAKAIFEGMDQQWGVAPNVYHYTSLVTCLLKAGQWSEAIAITDKMETEGVTPNTRFLNHMMQAAVEAKQWVAAEAIFRAMTEKYGHSNASRQSTLHFLQSMVMQKKLRKAISYVARVQSFSLSGPASKGTMDCLLLKWFRTIPGVGSEALAGVLMTMIDKGVKLHPDSYSVVISKANKDGNKALSATLYKMLLAANGTPSLSAANAAIKGCTQIDSAMEIVASLREHSLSPDKFTYAALLHCCANAGADQEQGQRATQVWKTMLSEGVKPHGGMLASYLLALMRSGDWKLALETRELFQAEQLSHAERHVGELQFVSREGAVVDSVVANGLVDNGQSPRALTYAVSVLETRPERDVSSNSTGGEDLKRFVDEDNHTALAGIRACRLAGSCETATGILEACEARWAEGPLVRDGEGDAGSEAQRHEWQEMLVGTRDSRKRLYDCLVSLLDEKGAKFSDIRRVLERGMKTGAVSLMKDQLGSTTSEQAVDFHGWSPRSANCFVRCILEDLIQDSDFLLSTGQYDLGRAVVAQGMREFGHVDDRWHEDSPDPRGRRREFADGVKPARFGEREYGKGRKRAAGTTSNWEKPEGGWAGEGADETQAGWWKREKRLTFVVGKPRPPPCIRNSVEEFCMLGVRPPLRVRKDASNPGILTLEPEDVRAWLRQKPTILA